MREVEALLLQIVIDSHNDYGMFWDVECLRKLSVLCSMLLSKAIYICNLYLYASYLLTSEVFYTLSFQF